MSDALIIPLIVSLAAFLLWSFVDQRRKLRDEIKGLLQATVIRSADGKLEFSGREARILLKDDAFLGTEESGPLLAARYLCQMPAGPMFWVNIESGRGGAQGTSAVSRLSTEEIDDLLARYPYLPALRQALGK